MASEDPSKRLGPTGPKKKIEVLEPPSVAAKYLPYALAAFLVVALVGVIVRVPTYATYAATVLLSGASIGLGYLAWQDSHGFAPDDSFRKVVGVTTVAVVLTLIATTVLTLHPPAPLGTVSLPRVGASGDITVARGNHFTVRVEGAFAPDVGPSARASYLVLVSRAGGRTEELEGEFERSAGENPATSGNMAASASGEVTARQHRLLEQHGPGRYTITLDRSHENLRLPLRVSLHPEWVPPWVFVAVFAVLLVLVLVADVGIAKRNIEPVFAPALFFAMAMVFYLQRTYAGSGLSDSLFAAFLVGLLGGGLGGELVARAARGLFA
jgi:hypothetical protein